MLKKILGGMAVVILGIVAYASLQSADYQVSREIVVKASPEVPAAETFFKVRPRLFSQIRI